MTSLQISAEGKLQMSFFRRVQLIVAASAACLITACTQPISSGEAVQDRDHSVATVKPGASIKFSHTISSAVSANTPEIIEIVVNEPYSGGALWLQATGDDGLNVLSGDAPVRFDMYSVSQHKWSVRVSADADGVYYLNVFATVEPEGRSKSMRSYAVRIEVGGGSAGVQSKSSGVLGKTPDGETIVILDAEEEIIDSNGERN